MKLRTLAAALLLLVGSITWAQTNEGEVQIYIFAANGLPMEDVTLTIDGEVYESNSSGLLNFTHPPGRHEFELEYEGSVIARVTAPVRQAQTTEVIVTATEGEQTVDTTGSAEPEDPGADGEEITERAEIDPDAPTGTIVGEVTHAESGDPVSEATVIFREVNFETTTDEEGRFEAPLPRGTYSFSIIHPEFSTQTRDQVEVAVDDETNVTVQLTPAGITLDAVPVFATEEIRVQGGIANLIEETRNSSVVLNLIGSEQMGRTGDSDAAAALRRVTGLTIVDGRFVYVRGMGERYSSSMLNAARLPSPEIGKRVVPLDLFPTSVIESLAIQKTYSPELPGDFGGGLVEIRSVGIPDDRYRRRLRTTVKSSLGWNLGTTLTDRLMEERGELDFLGIDDGSRAMPDEVAELERIDGSEYTDTELEEIAESFPVDWEPTVQTVPPDFSLSASVRDKIELSDVSSIGFVTSALFKHSWDYSEQQDNSWDYDEDRDRLIPQGRYLSDLLSRDIDFGGLLDLTYEAGPDFRVESTTLLVRATDGATEQYEGYYGENDVDLQVTEQWWIEQTLINQRLAGEVGLGFLNNSNVFWQYAFSRAQRYEPDHRYVVYTDDESEDQEFTEETKELYSRDFTANRWYTEVGDTIHDGMIGLSLPVFLFGTGAADYIDVGGQFVFQDRTAATRRFNLTFNQTTADRDKLGQDPNELLGPDSIDIDGNEDGVIDGFFEGTQASDLYVADHLIAGGYVSADILLPLDIRLNAGTRYEWSRQTVESDSNVFAEEFTSAQLIVGDWLPAVNMTVPVTDRAQIRLGGSRTVNRPGLRELSQAPLYGKPGAGALVGNPELQRAVIYNADLRNEWYIAEGESASIGAFYKYFQNPIELVEAAGAADITTYQNVPQAYNVGAELEWQLRLRAVSDLLRNAIYGMSFESYERELRWRRALGGVSSFFRDMRTSGNVSWIRSRINYGEEYRGDNTNKDRPLQGQSPYVVNVSLGYKNSVSWSQMRHTYTSVFLNYNVFGPRISAIGTGGADDIYEQPFHRLDLVFNHQFSLYFSVGLSAKNLIDPRVLETVGSDPNAEGVQVVQDYRKGRSFGISATLDL